MAENVSRWSIQPSELRVRLDHYLARHIPNQSRSQIQIWIRNGQVQVNGAKAKSGYLLRPGDEIAWFPPAEPSAQPQPEAIPLTVLYQDRDLAVIEKPAGMVCHLGAAIRSGTLVNALLYHLGPIEAGDPLRPGIVHRLDKQTSGVMVVAKNSWSHHALSQQFKSREVKKEYLALVYGRPRPTKGTIDLPLGRDPWNRKKISVRARRQRKAVTHYQIEGEYGPFSLLKIRIETGRTHQIRVHLSHTGHPVVGDDLYGKNWSRSLRQARWRAAVDSLQRLFLHASRLEFRHPRNRENLCFNRPLPPELKDFLAQL